jgi:hypothetical protein
MDKVQNPSDSELINSLLQLKVKKSDSILEHRVWQKRHTIDTSHTLHFHGCENLEYGFQVHNTMLFRG